PQSACGHRIGPAEAAGGVSTEAAGCGGSTRGCAGTSSARGTEKSTPTSDTPHTHRGDAGGFSVSQTGQTRTSALTRRTLPAPRHFFEREPARCAQRLDARHVAASGNADHPDTAAFDADLH